MPHWMMIVALLAGPPGDTLAGEASRAMLVGAKDASPRAAWSEFRPSRHGFGFVNSFKGSPLPVPLGNLERRLGLPERFGLCGGMSFAAADFYLAGRVLREEIPSRQPPAQGTSLYAYLHQRQSASLGPMAVMGTKFMEWMQRPETGEDGTHARTRAELEAIAAAMERGEGVMLGLVLVSAGASRAVWNNHQVLVYGITPAPGAAERDGKEHGQGEGADGQTADGQGPAKPPPMLRIYDPNYPDRDDVVLRWVEGEDPRWERAVLGEMSRAGQRARTTRVRGFFVMPYEPQEPPRGLEASALIRGDH